MLSMIMLRSSHNCSSGLNIKYNIYNQLLYNDNIQEVHMTDTEI